MNQADMLEYLQKVKTTTTKQALEELGGNSGSAYRKLQALAKTSWVKIESHPESRQSNLYILTEAGEKADPESIRPPTI